MRKMKLLGGVGLVLMACLFLGCNSNSPVATGFTNDGGYSINLGATSGNLPFGGRLALTVVIKDSKGEVVQLSPYPVTFLSELGGEFTPLQAQIASGMAFSIYVAPKSTSPGASIRRELGGTPVPTVSAVPTAVPLTTDLPIVDTLTASFMGASARLSIALFKP